MGEIRGMLPFLVQRSLGCDLGGLPGRDQSREALAFRAEPRDLMRQRVALLCHRAAQSRQLGEIGRQRLGSALQLRDHGPEQHRCPDREEHVVRADQHRGQGLPAHPLQGGQHLADESATRNQRLLDRILAAGQKIEPLFDPRHLAFGRADAVGGFDQRGRETDPIGPDRLKVGFGPFALRFGGGGVRVEVVELLLLLAEVDGRLGGVDRRGGLRRSGHDANEQQRGQEQARQPVRQQP